MKRLVVLGLSVYVILAATVYAQNTGDTGTATVTAASMGLKDAYAGKFLIGAAGDIPKRYSENELANIKANYDVITPENCMKPRPIHPWVDTYNFAISDTLVQWCQDNDIKVWGHTLAWHSQTPPWFFEAEPSEPEEPAARPARPRTMAGNRRGPRPSMSEFWRRSITGPMASREVAMERLKNHIITVVGRYKGRIIGWDVFNESIADSGDCTTENLRTFSWYEVVGPDVLTMAFKWAHEVDPDAQLYYNDYNIEQGAVENKGKHASSMLLLKRLIDEGAPVTGVGIQGHWHLDTNLADVEQAIINYASLGLKVAITELDVTATGSNSGAFGGFGRNNEPIPPENYEKQAEVYKALFEIFIRHSDVIDRVTFWGISDTRSWRRGRDALLFDGELQPKPAYQAIMDLGTGKNVHTQ
ncbi:endo-1,4-beta-xylanase [candidate division KSB1 bacterium]|nr:endo-1,4-beta-xylanase [candidate division KSB1 bacterium]